jgi:hypothetical protein
VKILLWQLFHIHRWEGWLDADTDRSINQYRRCTKCNVRQWRVG